MSSPRVASTAALPIAHGLLRILIVVNWLVAVLILVLLLVIPNREWILSAFKIAPSPDADQVIFAMRAIAVLGLVGVPFNYVVLKRLLAIVETVRDGDPFVAVNAARLQTIAWSLLVLQVISIVIGGIAKSVS